MVHGTETGPRQVMAACRSALGAVGGFSFLMNLLMLTVPVYMMQLFDRVLASGSRPTLFFLTAIALLALLILAVLDVVRARIMEGCASWIERRLGGPVLRRAMQRAVTAPGEAGEMTRDLSRLRGFLGSPAALHLFDAPWVPVYLLAVFLLHPLLGLVALVGSLVLLLLVGLNALALRAPSTEAGRASAAATRGAEAALRNAEAVVAMGLLQAVERRWQSAQAVAVARHGVAARRGSLIASASRFFRQVVQISVLCAGALLVVAHEITVGAMIAASILMGRGLAPVEQAISTARQALGARSAYKALKSAFDTAQPPQTAMPLPRPRGRLTVENAGFSIAPGAPPILKGVSLTVEPGEAVAVVGPSGSGKSTLARLMVGIWKPTIGAVRLDGADVFHWSSDDLGRHVGYLPQDVELFSGTIRENIARLDDGPPEAVVAAAQETGCHGMILGMPTGYDTQIGEGGRHLSGGQRQRLGLARAVYGDPRLVVLDEPTANLDGGGEDAVNGAIAALKARGVAVVVVGHRPSILANVDKILVLVDGRMEQFGPRAEVASRLVRRTLHSVGGEAPAPAPGSAPARRTQDDATG